MEELLANPLFQALFNSPVPRIIVEANAPIFTIVTSNDAHKSVTNLTGREIAGKSVWEIFDPNEAGGDGGVVLKDALTAAQLTNQTVLMPPFRYDMGAPDGKGMVQKWWQLEIMPVGREGFQPKFLLTTTNDITDRVMLDLEKENLKNQLERRVTESMQGLFASESRFKNLVQQAPIALAFLSGESLIIDSVNLQMLKLWTCADQHISADLAVGREFSEIFPSIGDQWSFRLSETFVSGQEQQFELLHEDAGNLSGHSQYHRVFLHPVFQKEKVCGLVVSAIDVTEQVNIHKDLERAFEKIRLSKLAAQLGTFDMDIKNRHLEWDQRCRELFGISHDAEITYESDFMIGLHPEDRSRIIPIVEALLSGENSEGNYDVEYRTIGIEDKKQRWVRAKGKVYHNGLGEPVRFIGSVLDITDQKHEEQLRSDFIAMASHELKTPLTSLMAYMQVLDRQQKKLGVDSGLFGQAQKQVNKMVKMINGFLDVSKLESGKMTLKTSEVQISELISEAISEIHMSTPGTEIQIHFCDQVTVRIDREKIEHVMMNLFSNALKYSKGDEPILVECKTDENWVTISVQDHGIGIKQGDQQRIFERYFRVEDKAVNLISGFGIGLYLCQEIVRLHGGTIWVDSMPGKGSVFSFRLPR